MPDLITIEKLVYGGEGLARVDGRVVLTPFVLPGEQVMVEPEGRVAFAAPHGRTGSPACRAGLPVFRNLRGMPLPACDDEYQLDQKFDILREVMRRVGNFEAPQDIQHLRTRVAVSKSEPVARSYGQLGYLNTGSHELVPIDHCPISSPMLNECIVVSERDAQGQAISRSS